MAPKRPSPLDEPPSASSSSSECEEDEAPSSPSLSSDSGSDSEHRWVAKPKSPNPKKAKKNGEEHLSSSETNNTVEEVECRPREECTSTAIGMAVSKDVEKACEKIPSLSMREDIFKKGLELIGASKRAELEKRWNELHVAQLELYIEHVKLVADQAKLICEAYNSSNK
ncbi:STOREKEEPER protein-like [Sesbania bispinosa]|nr:STOREKEEPER protein-like [Sesbania bispinosa]